MYGEKKSFKEKIKLFWQNPKKRRLTIIIGSCVILIALAVGYYFYYNRDNASEITPDVTEKTTEPTLYQSPLDGTMVSKDDANRHPLGIMVENHVDARPQSGLSQASIVWEAIAEGGITRFLAVFGPRGAEKVGPVRSARTYYVDWIKELNGYYAHVGGNYDALQKIKTDGILDLDQFANSAAYWRDKSRNVSSEHTMYTATSKLYQIASDKGYQTENTWTPYKFKDDMTLETRPASEQISINFGNSSYNVVYDYDRTDNVYKRSQGGAAHIDAENKAQIQAKNVVIMTVNRTQVTTAINEKGYAMTTTGGGEASVFIDGTQIAATWKKDSGGRTRFINKATGIEIEFNAGQTWIDVISPDLSFSVK